MVSSGDITLNDEAHRHSPVMHPVYFTHVTFRLYIEEADDVFNKVSHRREKGVRANLCLWSP